MVARVRFRLDTGRIVELQPGDVIGRARSAKLRLDDPRIAEVHAVVSARGATLQLISHATPMTIGALTVADVVLTPGLALTLAPGLTLTVEEVELPECFIAVRETSSGSVVVPQVASVDAHTGRLVSGVREGALAVLWIDDELAHLRIAGQPDRELLAGASFEVGGHRFEVICASAGQIVSLEAPRQEREVGARMTLRVRYDTVHVVRDREVLTIDGVPARIITELALIRSPVEWQSIATQIWPHEDDELALRRKWDGALARLRKRLRELDLRRDLVRCDRGGHVELLLGPDDHIEDAA